MIWKKWERKVIHRVAQGLPGWKWASKFLLGEPPIEWLLHSHRLMEGPAWFLEGGLHRARDLSLYVMPCHVHSTRLSSGIHCHKILWCPQTWMGLNGRLWNIKLLWPAVENHPPPSLLAAQLHVPLGSFYSGGTPNPPGASASSSCLCVQVVTLLGRWKEEFPHAANKWSTVLRGGKN